MEFISTFPLLTIALWSTAVEIHLHRKSLHCKMNTQYSIYIYICWNVECFACQSYQFYPQNTYICISRGINMLLDEREKKIVSNIQTKHSLFIKDYFDNSNAESFTPKQSIWFNWCQQHHLWYPIGHNGTSSSLVSPYWPHLLGFLLVCALWFKGDSWGVCRQRTSFTDSLSQNFLDLFKALCLPN